MKIGELATLAQCTVETVRYYEKAQLLPEPARTAGNFRVYGPEHIERLQFIRNCRALDMSQEEIRSLIVLAEQPGQGCGAINAVFDQHIAHVDARIRELQQLKKHLRAIRERCASKQAVDACGIMLGLTTMETQARAERHTHLG